MLPSYSQFRSIRLFGSLDALRALSILAVIWHHAGGAHSSLTLLQHGFLGVDMFFVLSGFLIVTLLLRERDRAGSIDLGRFYLRRTLRIMPVYYVVLLLLSVLLGVVLPHSSLAGPFFDKLPYYLTYTSNWLPDVTLLAITWSLATEEQFYLFWPPVEKYLRRGATLAVLVAFTFANQSLNFQLGLSYWPTWLVEARSHLEILQVTFTPICLGVLLAHTLHDPRGFAIVQRFLSSRRAQIVTMTILLIAASVPGDISGFARLTIQLSMTALLASCVIREDHALVHWLGWEPLRRLGAVSYGMYLYHPFVLHGVNALLGRLGLDASVVRFALCTGLTYGVAVLSYRHFESVFLAWKERLDARWRGGPATAQAATNI